MAAVVPAGTPVRAGTPVPAAVPTAAPATGRPAAPGGSGVTAVPGAAAISAPGAAANPGMKPAAGEMSGASGPSAGHATAPRVWVCHPSPETGMDGPPIPATLAPDGQRPGSGDGAALRDRPGASGGKAPRTCDSGIVDRPALNPRRRSCLPEFAERRIADRSSGTLPIRRWLPGWLRLAQRAPGAARRWRPGFLTEASARRGTERCSAPARDGGAERDACRAEGRGLRPGRRRRQRSSNRRIAVAPGYEVSRQVTTASGPTSAPRMDQGGPGWSMIGRSSTPKWVTRGGASR